MAAAAQNAPNLDVAHQISLATGLDNVAPNAAHQGRTMAGAIAHELFQGSFDTFRDKKVDIVYAEMKILRELAVGDGRIHTRPAKVTDLKALIQWVQDEFQYQRNPAETAFPVAEQPRILHRQAELTHYITMSRDKTVTWTKYTKNDDWMLWKPTFEINLSNTPGRSGIPLSRVVRANEAPDLSDRDTIMLFYVHSTPLAGEDYVLDNKTVYNKLMEVLSGNLEMEKEIQQFAATKNGQGAFFACCLKEEGEGLTGRDYQSAKWIIQQLVYKGEQRHEYNFASFKTSIKWAFATIHKIEARMVYSNCQMTDILMPKIQAEWLQVIRQQVQGRINRNEMTFEQALKDFEQGVQSKYPITGIPGSNHSTRRISEVSQGRGDNARRGGRGRGGRGHGIGGHSGRGGREGRGGRCGRGGCGGRAAPLKNITLLNGRQIDYHPSYQFSQEEFFQMTQTDYDELIRARRGFRERQGHQVSETGMAVGQPDALTQAVANAYVQHTLQVGQANLTALPPISATARAPPSTITSEAPTQITQISAAASSVM